MASLLLPPRLWLVAIIFLLASMAGCIGLASEDPAQSPPFKEGDHAIYEWGYGGETQHKEISILGRDTVMYPNGTRSEAIIVNLGSNGEADRRVAITPTDHRLIQVIHLNDCEIHEQQCDKERIYNGNGVPWMFGSGIEAPTIEAYPDALDLPIPGPNGTIQTATYQAEGTEQGTLIETTNAPRVRASIAYGGPDVTIRHDHGSPFPRQVTLNDLSSNKTATFQLESMTRGEGPSLGSRPSNPEPDPAFWRPLPNIAPQPIEDRVPPTQQDFPEPFPLETAMDQANTDDRFQTFLMENPDAMAVVGSFATSNRSVLPTGSPDTFTENRWQWDLTFASQGTEEGWEVTIVREHDAFGEEETEVTRSQSTTIDHLPGLPPIQSLQQGEHIPFDRGIEQIQRLPIPQPESTWSFHAIAPASWYEEPRYTYFTTFLPTTEDDNGGRLMGSIMDIVRIHSRTGLIETASLQPETLDNW